MNYKYIFVDGPYLSHKSFGAPYKVVTSDGLDATMVHSFISSMNALRKKFEPERMVVAWESHGTKSWRKNINPSYKSRLKGNTHIFWDGIKDVQIILHLLGVKQYYSPSNEADDVLANLCCQNSGNILVYTSDKDIMQLVSDTCHVYDGKTLFDSEKVREKFFVNPEQIPDLLAVWGDKTDNIEGINSYGIRKSAHLLNKYNSVEAIPKEHTVRKYMNKILLNKKLATLNKNCMLYEIPNKDFKTNETIETMFNKYELKKMKNNINEYKLMGKGDLESWLKN